MKNFKKAVMIILLCVMAVGCSSIDQIMGKTSNGPKEITVFYASANEGRIDNLWKESKQKFEQMNDDVIVNLHGVSLNKFLDELQKMYDDGTPPDVIMMQPPEYADYERKGYLKDLMPFLKADHVTDAFDEHLLQFTTINNKLIGIPVEAVPIIVAYNKTWYDHAKLPYPEDDWTWDDFIHDAIELKQANAPDSDLNGAVFPLFDQYVEALVMSKGGSFISPDGKTVKGYLDSPKTAEAISWLNNFYNVQHISVMWDPQYIMSSQNDWLTNQSGLVIMFYHLLNYLSPEVKANIGIVGFPKFEDSPRTSFMSTNAMGITAQSKQPELAWKYVRMFAIDDSDYTRELLQYGFNSSSLLSEAVAEDPFEKVRMNEFQYGKPDFFSLNKYYIDIVPMLDQELIVNTLYGRRLDKEDIDPNELDSKMKELAQKIDNKLIELDEQDSN